MIGAVPISTLARLHLSFNTNKAFLLPTALASMQKLRRLYIENAPCKLLVVGHADTKGGAAFNDELSLARARATIAYLKDDVDAWLEFYELNDPKQVWGKVEDHLMLIAMPDFSSKPRKESEVAWFQRTRGLSIDGEAGKQTRTALIGEYMSLDGASLADIVGEVDAVAHGCGENFPLDDGEEELDPAPQDEKRDPGDRRVELFFFDNEFGISPKPPADNSKPGSSEYPKWRERVAAIVDLSDDDLDAPRVTFVEMADAHFRTNSAVVLPEGENPDQKGEHQALTSVGLVATALRFNEENAGRTLLVAGHADTTADASFNQKLSEERAEVALCLLLGGNESRERFKALCDARHTVADIEQILSWIAKTIAGFDCDPGVIDGQLGDAPVRKFQTAYNANKATLNADPAIPPLTVDGSVGKLTWGAFFDCYELALREELGEDAIGVAALRRKLRFADDKRRFLGFSEHFPIEELGVDNFRSQSNRRVELVFFEPGEEADLERAASDPATSELYLPGQFERMPLPAMASARRRTLTVDVVDHLGLPVENRSVTLFLPDGRTLEVRTDESGRLTAKVPLGVVSMLLEDGRFLNFGEGYADYKHDPVNELQAFPDEADGSLIGNDRTSGSVEDHNESMALLSTFDDDLAPLP
jgi:outer membrane protein OmpA-like peptidoglycan-associated protein/peptidoglycan hydrolase-like protein with peptidoglycan-binding domain